MKQLKISALISFILILFSNFLLFPVNAEATPIPTVDQKLSAPAGTTTKDDEEKSNIYIADIVDAADISKFSPKDFSNIQQVSIAIKSGPKSGTRIEDVSFTFPNSQFKRPLKVGDAVIVETTNNSISNSNIRIISFYRQNNILVWALILIGLFILVSGLRSNLRYLFIFIITIISGILVLVFYHTSTYLTFGLVFLWQVAATIWFAYGLFRKKTPAIILSLSVLGNQFLAMGLVFVMKNINIFDTGFFELFFQSANDAREVMMYVFAVLALYPISVVFAERVISESIKKKSEDNKILRINLIRYVSTSALRALNNIFLTFFGLFFAIFIGIIAITSSEGITFNIINSASVSQILSVGFLILFNVLIFIPVISFISGMWLGTLESHELVTDKNVKQLEL